MEMNAGKSRYVQTSASLYTHQVVGVATPNRNIPVDGQWNTGLCGCFEDPGNCFLTCCCPCVTVGLIAEVLDEGATTWIMGAIIYTVLHLASVPCIYSCSYRRKLRRLYAIEGGPWNDCIIHCCCDYCAICQQYRELKLRGRDPSLGWQEQGDVVSGARRGGSTTAPPVAPRMYH